MPILWALQCQLALIGDTMQYTIKATPQGYTVTARDGTAKQFAKLWLALSFIENQLKD